MVRAAVFWKLLGRFVKIMSKEDWGVAELKYVLTFIRLVNSKVWQKSANYLNLLQFLEPVSMLKSPAMIMLSNFDSSWFANSVVFSKKSFAINDPFMNVNYFTSSWWIRVPPKRWELVIRKMNLCIWETLI